MLVSPFSLKLPSLRICPDLTPEHARQIWDTHTARRGDPGQLCGGVADRWSPVAVYGDHVVDGLRRVMAARLLGLTSIEVSPIKSAA